jgi:hypothetical protein
MRVFWLFALAVVVGFARDIPHQPVGLRSCYTKAGSFGVDLTGEFLYWKPYEGGTEFAIQHKRNAVIGSISAFSEARSVVMRFHYDPGVRVGVAWHMPYEGWFCAASAAYLHTSSHTTSSGTLFPQFLLQPAFATGTSQYLLNANQATADWHLKYGVVDVVMGREQHCCKSLLWTPYLGAKAAMLHQKFQFLYGADEHVGVGFAGNSSVRAVNQFNGMGLQGGVKGDWVLGRGLRFLTNMSSGCLWGTFVLRNHQVEGGTTVVSWNSKQSMFVPTTTLMTALTWGTRYRKGYVGVSVGWEMQYWWRQNQLPQFIDATIGTEQRLAEDLSLQGLNASLYWNF